MSAGFLFSGAPTAREINLGDHLAYAGCPVIVEVAVRIRNTQLWASGVRRLATVRGYAFVEEDGRHGRFKLLRLGKAIRSSNTEAPYSWKLAEADAWLREQPVLKVKAEKGSKHSPTSTE